MTAVRRPVTPALAAPALAAAFAAAAALAAGQSAGGEPSPAVDAGREVREADSVHEVESVHEVKSVHYRSNAIGIPFERIAPAQAGGHRFVLVDHPAVEQGETTLADRVLLEDGREVRRWETRRGAGGDLLAEYDYVGGVVVDERVFHADGRLSATYAYEGGELVNRTTYTYEPRTVRVESIDADGSVRYRATYELAATGQVRDFVRLDPGQDRFDARFVFGGGALVEEIVEAGSTRLVSRYLAGARYRVEEWRDGALHGVRDLERSSEGFLIAETRTEPAADRRTITRFDAAGQVIEVITEERGAQVASVRHRRDDAGRIVTTQRETGDGGERWDFQYAVDAQTAAAAAGGPDDRLREVRHRQNGVLVSVAAYREAGDSEAGDSGSGGGPPLRQVDYYRDGVPERRVFFRGDERLREQVIRDGAVIRERVFDGGAGADG